MIAAICSKNGKVGNRLSYLTILGFVVLFEPGIVPPASLVRTEGKIDLSLLLATSPRLPGRLREIEKQNGREKKEKERARTVKRPLGKEQSRVKLQEGLGRGTGRTKKLREIYRNCRSSIELRRANERREGVSIKKVVFLRVGRISYITCDSRSYSSVTTMISPRRNGANEHERSNTCFRRELGNGMGDEWRIKNMGFLIFFF